MQEKSWDLSFLMNMLNEAREMNDDVQVKKIAQRAIKEAEQQGEGEWKAKFQEILDEYSQGISFDSHEGEEIEPDTVSASQGNPDLSQVKGIGTSMDAKLRSNGFTSIVMLAATTPEQLARVPGIGLASAQKVIENARTFLGTSSGVPPKVVLEEPEVSPVKEITPYQKLLARAKETAQAKSESQEPTPKVEKRRVVEQKPEPKLADWAKKPEPSQVMTPLAEESEPVIEDSPIIENPQANEPSIALEVEEIDELEEKFEEEFEEETEYKPINSSLFSTKEQFLKEDDSEVIIEPEPRESLVTRELETTPVEKSSPPIRVQEFEVSKPAIPSKESRISSPPKVPYREARMSSLPNGKQLIQRQQSAQKILRIIQEAGMVEIPMNTQELRDVFQAVDLLACKPMKGENGRCIILLVPIKHVITAEPVYVWDSHVVTGTLDDEPTTSANMAINTHVKKLVNASEYLFSEIINGKSVISLVSRFVGIATRTEAFFRNKRLYIGGKEIEFQVILDPILLSDTEVYCLEKTLPYAYQQGSNLHVVSFEHLDELLEYLQVKYRLLNRHDTSQNAIMKTDEVKTSTFKQLQLFSLPFLAYGLLFSFFLLLGMQEAIRFCISLGYGLMFVYAGFIGFLVFRHFKSMKRIESDFSVPYHQRGVDLSQEDLILINEQLSHEWMAQFSHEVESPRREVKQKKIKTKFVVDTVYTPQSGNQYSLNPKYRTFVDD